MTRGVRVGSARARNAKKFPRFAQGGGSTNLSALARMDRDMIVQTGATHLILLLGIDDITRGLSAENVIAALQHVVIRARTQQLKSSSAR